MWSDRYLGEKIKRREYWVQYLDQCGGRYAARETRVAFDVSKQDAELDRTQTVVTGAPSEAR